VTYRERGPEKKDLAIVALHCVSDNRIAILLSLATLRGLSWQISFFQRRAAGALNKCFLLFDLNCGRPRKGSEVLAKAMEARSQGYGIDDDRPAGIGAHN
jgi:hypothetical protein